jgi:3-mercaptopyruvate sulfurtransferase SseA
LVQKLIDKGYTKVYALKGGWNEWVKSKYPLEQRVRESAEKTKKGEETVPKKEKEQEATEEQEKDKDTSGKKE